MPKVAQDAEAAGLRETRRLGQHVKGEPSNIADRDRDGRRAATAAERAARTTGSSTATTAWAATPRPSTRCSTRRATSAGPYKGIFAELAPSDASELEARNDALGRAFIDQGITFSLSGQERPFPLDLVPRVISAAEWSRLEKGIRQRVKALEMYLDDIYGEQEILRDGVIPRRLVTSCEHFHREAAGIVPPNGVRIHVAGIDLVRDAQGNFRVLEDNLRSPSGVSYVMENRRTMARVFPNLFATHRVRAVGDYSSHLLRALRNAARHQRGRSDRGGADARASTTPPTSSTRCWPGRWASNSSRAATCSAATTPSTCAPPRASVRSTSSTAESTTTSSTRCSSTRTRCSASPVCSTPRAQATSSSPVRSATASATTSWSTPTCPRSSSTTSARSRWWPTSTPTGAGSTTSARKCSTASTNSSIKPVEGSGGYGIVFGPDASEKELATISKKIRSDPRGWIAQPVVQLSTVPTQIDDKLAPRHVDLRPFAVNDGDDVWVLPGGLTRVALPEGSLVVNSSQGGGSKDTWVLASRASVADRELAAAEVVRKLPKAPKGAKADKNGESASQSQQQQAAIAVPGPGRPAATAATTAATTVGGEELMLARNAESLYWIGRYVERADDTARILDVTVHQLLEDSSVDPDQASRTLLRVLGIEAPERAARRVVADRPRRFQPRHPRVAARSSTRSRRRARMQEAHAKSRPPRSGSASTPPTTRWPNASAPPNGSALPSSCPYRRGPRRDVRRAGRLDAVPRRRLPVHGAGSRDRTRRHDRCGCCCPGSATAPPRPPG